MKVFVISLLLSLILGSSYANEAELIIHILKGKPANWTSPSSLLLSNTKNAFFGGHGPVGHTMVEFRKLNGEVIRTGMTINNKFKSLCTVLTKGIGIGIMNEVFRGRFETNAEILASIEKAKKLKRYTRLSVKLDPQAENKIDQFIKDWFENQSYENYGACQNVAKGEGSICSDFSSQLLNLALDGKAPINQWLRKVEMPLELLPQNQGGRIKKPSIFRVLFGNKWADANEGKVFTATDPSLMYQYVASAKNTPSHTYPTRELKKSELEMPSAESNESLWQYNNAQNTQMNQKPLKKLPTEKLQETLSLITSKE